MDNDTQLLEDSIFKIGTVVSVDGRIIRIKVDKAKNTSHLLYKEDLLKNISVGGYIKIAKGFTKIVGKVEGEFTSEDPLISRKNYWNDREKINRILSVSLLGFFKGEEFERGIKELPLVGNECFLLKNEEFNQVHDFIGKGDDPITIGTLALEKGQKISVGINSLFASHIGIFGNTGSGKSYTLAKIYRELFDKFKDEEEFKANAQFFILDFNGEYVDETGDIIVEKKYKNLYRLSTKATGDRDRFPISPETIQDADFWYVFLEATEKTQTPFLRRAISNDYVREKLTTVEGVKILLNRLVSDLTDSGDPTLEKATLTNLLIDMNVSLGNSLTTLIQDYQANLHYHSKNACYYYLPPAGGDRIFSDNATFKPTYIDAKIEALELDISGLTPIDVIRLQLVFQYYDEIIKGYSNREHLAPLMKRMEKKVLDLQKVISIEEPEETGKNITVISLKDVNIHMRKVLPLLLAKRLYDEKKEKNDPNAYLNIVIDEAHNILSDSSERESGQWKDYRLETFEEIIKEGRKFGVFLTIASQRPADISPTIISQLHNYFLHRLINNNDIQAIEKTISYLDKVSFDYLPILPTGTCILAGLLAQVPVVIDIGSIPKQFEPNNKTMTLVEKWRPAETEEAF